MCSQAKTGLTLSIIGLVLAVVSIVLALVMNASGMLESGYWGRR